jgi:hypothetical protein
MDALDVIVKAAAGIASVVGVLAITVDQLSARRRKHAEEMRQLQLAKLRYEIEKIIKDGVLTDELYRSVERRYDFQSPSVVRIPADTLEKYWPRLPVGEMFLLFQPAFLSLLLITYAMIAGAPIRAGFIQLTTVYLVFWQVSQVILAYGSYVLVFRRISRPILRMIACLSGSIVILVITFTIVAELARVLSSGGE